MQFSLWVSVQMVIWLSSICITCKCKILQNLIFVVVVIVVVVVVVVIIIIIIIILHLISSTNTDLYQKVHGLSLGWASVYTDLQF